MRNWVCGAHAEGPTGHETLYWVWRTHPLLGPPMELLMGQRNAVLSVADACGHPHWGLRWSSLWGHET
eukprot:2421743-Pyramimonas_sp.AAC.1